MNIQNARKIISKIDMARVKYHPQNHNVLIIRKKAVGFNDANRTAFYYGKAQDLYLTNDDKNPLFNKWVLIDYYNDITPIVNEEKYNFKQALDVYQKHYFNIDENLANSFINTDFRTTDENHGKTAMLIIENEKQLNDVLNYLFRIIEAMMAYYEDPKYNVVKSVLNSTLNNKLIRKPMNEKMYGYVYENDNLKNHIKYLNDDRDSIFYQYSQSVYELADYFKAKSNFKFHRFVLSPETLEKNVLAEKEKNNLAGISIEKDFRIPVDKINGKIKPIFIPFDDHLFVTDNKGNKHHVKIEYGNDYPYSPYEQSFIDLEDEEIMPKMIKVNVVIADDNKKSLNGSTVLSVYLYQSKQDKSIFYVTHGNDRLATHKELSKLSSLICVNFTNNSFELLVRK
ncbi:hypothetical protein DY037_05715 [Apilactobacillus micheneri]|uniref:hypothetical protein n=1 Tax=Apilactobacillus micheneri TaxID=1899430 RepID=UPI00112929E0|nr:hypothetical protein [Apilactobacillus micheneri]TPR49278.1 hypothetical protein DY037_05715 [Apilactobacillus micheneri]